MEANIPKVWHNGWNLGYGKGLVRMSAIMSLVGHQNNCTCPFVTQDWMKWCHMSICLDLAWNWGFDANAMADWLLSNSSAGEGCMKFNSMNKFLSQMAWVVAFELAMYSASVVDRATVGCFLEDQAMAPPPIRNTNPDMDFWSISEEAQSASE